MKRRLDVLLVERGLAETRERAQALILAGEVRVNGRVLDKAGTPVDAAAEIAVRAPLPYVSRGGFTDVLLQRGAARVYAVDVGYGQLAWKLRQNPRVVVMDRINARYCNGPAQRALSGKLARAG